jgi:hypothetical protein
MAVAASPERATTRRRRINASESLSVFIVGSQRRIRFVG